MKRPLLFIFLMAISFISQAQEKVKPGELYKEGSKIRSPRLGVTATIPKNWNGLLPRGEEIFLLSPTNSFSEIFVMIPKSNSLEQIKVDWQKGFDMGNGFIIKPSDKIVQRMAETLAAELSLGNNTSGMKGYIEAKCGDYDICLISLLSSDAKNFESNKKSLQDFMDSMQFTKPSDENPYTNFDWDPFLRGKQLVTFSFDNKSSKETLVNLCGDGTFKAVFKKSGLFKDQGLKGKKKGTWSVNGIGPTTKLVLTIDKMGPVETKLEIRDEKIFANGERYFISNSEECK